MVQRIHGVPSRNPVVRLMWWAVKRKVRMVPEPMRVMARTPRVLFGHSMMEAGLQYSHHATAKQKELAAIRAATLIGCPF
jgi:alkylhydroperoxidase family enzyme